MSKRGENIYKRKDGRFEARYVKERDINDKIVKYGYVYGKTYTEAKLKKVKTNNEDLACATHNIVGKAVRRRYFYIRCHSFCQRNALNSSIHRNFN